MSIKELITMSIKELATAVAISAAEECPSECFKHRQQLQHPEALQEHCSGQESSVTTSRSIAGALQWPGSSSCSIQERCRSVPVTRQQQSVAEAMEAPVAASGSIAGALQWPGSSSCSVRERCRSVAVTRKQQLHTTAADAGA
jgi:hypothetical protein